MTFYKENYPTRPRLNKNSAYSEMLMILQKSLNKSEHNVVIIKHNKLKAAFSRIKALSHEMKLLQLFDFSSTFQVASKRLF